MTGYAAKGLSGWPHPALRLLRPPVADGNGKTIAVTGKAFPQTTRWTPWSVTPPTRAV